MRTTRTAEAQAHAHTTRTPHQHENQENQEERQALRYLTQASALKVMQLLHESLVRTRDAASTLNALERLLAVQLQDRHEVRHRDRHAAGDACDATQERERESDREKGSDRQSPGRLPLVTDHCFLSW